jgi:hypothetical protein
MAARFVTGVLQEVATAIAVRRFGPVATLYHQIAFATLGFLALDFAGG